MKKLKRKSIYLALAAIAIIYAGCKKSSTNPAGPTLAPQQVASQVVLNIGQSLFGGLGAFDITSGISRACIFRRAIPKEKYCKTYLTNPALRFSCRYRL